MLYAIFKASHPPWSHWGRSACPLTLRANPMCLCTENPTLTFHLRDLNLQKNLSCWCCRVDKNLLHLFVGHRTTSSKHLVAHFFPAPKSLTTKRSPLCSFGLHPRPASVRWKTPCYVVYTHGRKGMTMLFKKAKNLQQKHQFILDQITTQDWVLGGKRTWILKYLKLSVYKSQISSCHLKPIHKPSLFIQIHQASHVDDTLVVFRGQLHCLGSCHSRQGAMELVMIFVATLHKN